MDDEKLFQLIEKIERVNQKALNRKDKDFIYMALIKHDIQLATDPFDDFDTSDINLSFPQSQLKQKEKTISDKVQEIYDRLNKQGKPMSRDEFKMCLEYEASKGDIL